MIKLILIFFTTLQATFSIIAVDETNNYVASAGGSCIGGSIIISDIHPGVGAIHTQSYWNNNNQNYASELMEQGYSRYEIIAFLELNDAQNNPSIRQYGVVDLIEGGRSASYTGDNCSDWKGHINGISYAIQGNILLDESVLSNMEQAFLTQNGPLDVKVMAAMKAAKIPGADSRCLDEGISTLSAFIRIASPNDNDSYLMDLNVNNVTSYYNNNGIWIDPVDSLETLFNEWYEYNFDFTFGDINQDYLIDILDIVNLVNFILGHEHTGIEFYLADINFDNNLNIQDIIILLNIIIR